MQKVLILSILLSFLLLFNACEKEVPPVLNITATTIDVPNTQGTGSVSLTSNAPWVTSLTGTWFSISPSSGNGEAVITVTAQPNYTRKDRTASIIITTGQEGKTNYLKKIVTVNQSSSLLSLDINSITFEKSAESKTIKITSNTSWSLVIPTESSWLTVNTITGIANADLIFSATANTGSDRSSRVVLSYGDTLRTIDFLQKRAINNAPTAPTLTYPKDNSKGISRLLQCTWQASTDPDFDKITYTIEIADNSSFIGTGGKFLKSYDAISSTSFDIPEFLKEDTKYYWRVSANDSFGAKTVSQIFNFSTGTEGGYADGESRVAFYNQNSLRPNEIIFMGDGYTATDFINGGKFDQDMDEGIEAFFSVEPYKSYKKHFRVYKLAAYSKESGATQLDKGIVKETAFSSTFKGGSAMEADDERLYDFVSANVEGMQDTNPYYSGIQGKLQNTLIVLVVNEDRYAGTCWMWSDGRALAICPLSRHSTINYQYKSVVNHEAGGHGFGRLSDEYISAANKDKTISSSDKTSLQSWIKYGFYPNVDLTSDLSTIKWSHFIGKAGYAVAAHEGAHYYTFGVWRPEIGSCMINNIQYYNAPSRENMVKRILRTAHGVRVSEYVNEDFNVIPFTPIPNDPYNLNEFIRLDINKTNANVDFYTKSFNPLTFVQLAPPVLVEVKR